MSLNRSNKGFFLLLYDDRRIRILEAQKHVDPDPQHWFPGVHNWLPIGTGTILESQTGSLLKQNHWNGSFSNFYLTLLALVLTFTYYD